MPKLILGILCGLIFGGLAIATMIPLSFDDKRAAIARHAGVDCGCKDIGNPREAGRGDGPAG